jgi:hypothetical protein
LKTENFIDHNDERAQRGMVPYLRCMEQGNLNYEKNISTEQGETSQNTRLSEKDVHKAGQKNY